MRTHSEEKPFECLTCKKMFKDKSNLKQHEATHKDDKQFKCIYCEQGFSYARNMMRHVETHLKAKEKQEAGGSLKPSGFATSSISASYILAKSRGNEVGPFNCPECGVKFVNLKTLRHHCKTSHSVSATYKCSVCNKSWKNECDLRNHMKEHTDKKKRYICSYCPKSCDRPSDLEKHMRIHTGEKPFQCKVCEKSFGDKSLYLKHTRLVCKLSFQ